MKRKYLRNFLLKDSLEAGCDEAGRGCLAGPVYAAAVILPKGYKHPLLNDSKKIPEEAREELRLHIEHNALAYGVGFADPEEIDRHNILQATFIAMHRAIDQLKPQPESLLVDGNHFREYQNIPHTCIIKGDGRFKSIAAASILAKTYRDDFMKRLSTKYPHYEWGNNKGYGTAGHLYGIKSFGLTSHHRKSFTKAFQSENT
jgi:ribonuclease HII